MNDRYDETQLSAYLDGELTSEELEQVENWLSESESARRTLERLQTVSTCLTQLPVSPAPNGFSEAVLTASDAQRVDVSSPGTPQRYRVAVTAGVATVLALTLILSISPWIGFFGGDPQVDTLASATPSPASSNPESELRAEPGSQGLEAPAENGQKFVFNDTLDKAQVGQVISAMETTGNRAVVVKLTVVDVEQGLDQLRLLLQQHEIPRADASPPKDKARFSGAARSRRPMGDPGSPNRTTDGLVSVVVKASPGQMSEALTRFRREVVRELEIAGPVQVAALQQSPDGRRAFDALASYGRSPQKRLAKANRELRSAPATAIAAGKSGRAASASDAISVAPGGSAQVSMVLPSGLLSQVQKSGNRNREKETGSGEEVAGGLRSTQQPLLVVFLLVAEPQQSPARTKPEPDGAA